MEMLDATAVTATIEHRSLDEIQPYWRNPRVITEAAVNAVADSIKRYGYRNLITVDAQGVIINGHTRYAALRKLGVTSALAVMVADDLTEEQVREFRILDNKTGEFSEWDHDALIRELAEVEDETILDTYFPEMDLEGLEIGTSDPDEAPAAPVVKGDDPEPPKKGKEAKVVEVTNVTCPSCLNSFEVQTSTL